MKGKTRRARQRPTSFLRRIEMGRGLNQPRVIRAVEYFPAFTSVPDLGSSLLALLRPELAYPESTKLMPIVYVPFAELNTWFIVVGTTCQAAALKRQHPAYAVFTLGEILRTASLSSPHARLRGLILDRMLAEVYDPIPVEVLEEGPWT